MTKLLESIDRGHRGVSLADYLKRAEEALLCIRSLESLSNQGFVDIKLINDIRQVADLDTPALGVYLFQGVERERCRVAFTHDPRASSGAADSAHAVLSGMITLGDDDPVKVGMKCFQNRTVADRRRRLINECDTNSLLKRSGLSTIDIVGVAVVPGVDNDEEYIIMSKWDEELLTLDNQPWSLGFDESSGNVSTAQSAMSALGRLNCLGVAQNDAKIKNFASFRGGEVEATDFESSERFCLDDVLAIKGAVKVDIETLLGSLVKKGFFNELRVSSEASLSYYEIFQAVDSMMVSYLSEWLDSPSYDYVIEPVREAFATQLTFPGSLFQDNNFRQMRI